MTKTCPECGTDLKPVADWPDDWLYCPKCLYTEKVEIYDRPSFNPYLKEGY